MRIYIASSLHNLAYAHDLAEELRAAGRDVVSTWHDSDQSTITAESNMTREEKRSVARKCLSQVCASTHFVWIHGNAGERWGAAIEFGAALAPMSCRGQEVPTGREVYAVHVDDDARAPSVFGALARNVDRATLIEVLT